MREKHARHIADLRAYYESEISTLKEKLDLVNLPLDMEKSNQILLERSENSLCCLFKMSEFLFLFAEPNCIFRGLFNGVITVIGPVFVTIILSLMATDRCEHLERALTEASMRIRELENKNRHLERQLVRVATFLHNVHVK